MRYSELPLKELDQATNDTKAAIEQGQRILKALPRLPTSKKLEKLSDAAAKIARSKSSSGLKRKSRPNEQRMRALRGPRRINDHPLRTHRSSSPSMRMRRKARFARCTAKTTRSIPARPASKARRQTRLGLKCESSKSHETSGLHA